MGDVPNEDDAAEWLASIRRLAIRPRTRHTAFTVAQLRLYTCGLSVAAGSSIA